MLIKCERQKSTILTQAVHLITKCKAFQRFKNKLQYLHLRITIIPSVKEK